MAEVEAEQVVTGSLATVWDLFFESSRWPTWVDGFAAVEAEDGFPETGGSLSWRSVPAGRGLVSERVLEHEPRRLHRISFSDEHSSGELETRFAIEPSPDPSRPCVRVGQRMDYRLKGGGPLAPLTDRLFVRSQVRRSLERSLTRFATEVAEAEDAD